MMHIMMGGDAGRYKYKKMDSGRRPSTTGNCASASPQGTHIGPPHQHHPSCNVSACRSSS
jgi:hypothetical protein